MDLKLYTTVIHTWPAPPKTFADFGGGERGVTVSSPDCAHALPQRGCFTDLSMNARCPASDGSTAPACQGQ